jgi:hypothetical protein
VSHLPEERTICWDKTFRLIPSRYPPIHLFERIADPADWEILAHIEGLTNDRLREEIGDISLVPPDERINGPGASPIMAAFTHTGFPSRFTDGTYGVYYACGSQDGALREVVYHQERFLRRTQEKATRLEIRSYIGAVNNTFHDVRGGWPDVHDPNDYGAGQILGRQIRERHGNGIAYDSVRLAGAANIAVFRPKAIASVTSKPHVVQGPQFYLAWNGSRIDQYFEIGAEEWRRLLP